MKLITNSEKVYMPRTCNRGDGCGLFFKKSKYDLIDSVGICMNETSIISENDSHVEIDPFFLKEGGGLACLIQEKQQGNSKRNLCCANFHLFWDPTKPEIKLKQINHGLSMVKNLMKSWSKKHGIDYDSIGLIVCGDFNSGIHLFHPFLNNLLIIFFLEQNLGQMFTNMQL